jgi:hypothetical protein
MMVHQSGRQPNHRLADAGLHQGGFVARGLSINLPGIAAHSDTCRHLAINKEEPAAQTSPATTVDESESVALTLLDDMTRNGVPSAIALAFSVRRVTGTENGAKSAEKWGFGM